MRVGIRHVGVIDDLEKGSFDKSLIGVDLREIGNKEFTHSEFRPLFQ